MNVLKSASLGLVAVLTLPVSTGCNNRAMPDPTGEPPGAAAPPSGDEVSAPTNTDADQPRGAFDLEAIIAAWPPRPKLAAREMVSKYGKPLEVSSETLVWHEAGPFKRIMVTRKEIPHDFPKPHMDFIEHTISYNVPTDKVDDLVAFDASMTINKTAGEMSARCDLEGHNILTHNLANDIVLGTKSVADARKSFGENVVDDVLGKHPPYVEKLQFEPKKEGVAFADKPIIPGSPERVAGDRAESGEGEVLAFLIAIDENEVLAAAAASKKELSPKVMQYATMLHIDHGKHAIEAMKLGQSMKVTPQDTQAVDSLRVKGAAELAALVPLDGKAFEGAYLDAMIKGHGEALTMIDGPLMKAAVDPTLTKYLADTRANIAHHLEAAKSIRGEL